MGNEEENDTLVTTLSQTVSSIADSLATAARDVGGVGVNGEGSDDVDNEEWITLAESASYLGPLLKFLAIAHSLFAMSMLVAYYFLKVCCLSIS